MIYLGQGILFDPETYMTIRLLGDNSRPQVIFKDKTEFDSTLLSDLTGVNVSVTGL